MAPTRRPTLRSTASGTPPAIRSSKWRRRSAADAVGIFHLHWVHISTAWPRKPLRSILRRDQNGLFTPSMEGSYNQIRRRAVKFHFYLDFYLRTAHASSYPAEARRHAQLSENCGNSRLFQTARVPRAHVCAFTCAFHERARGGTRTAGGKGGKGGNRLQQSRAANSSTISSTSRCSGPTTDRPETGANRRILPAQTCALARDATARRTAGR